DSVLLVNGGRRRRNARATGGGRRWLVDCCGVGRPRSHPPTRGIVPMTPARHELSGGERAALDGVLTRLYEVISFDEGGEPDWDGMKDVFSRHARITRVTPEGIDHLDLPTFCPQHGRVVD